MKTTKSQSRTLAATISARARPDLWYVVDRGWAANIVLLIVNCYAFDRFVDRASPDNIATLQERMEIPPPPLFLYQSTAFSWPYSLGTLPIQTQTEMTRQVLEPNQSIVSIARPYIELENSPPPIRPASSATTTTRMPACNAYAPYIPSPTMQLYQSMAGEGRKVVCAHAPEPHGSARSTNSGSGVSVGCPATPLANVQRKSSVLVGQSPISPPTFLHPLPPLSCYGTSIT